MIILWYYTENNGLAHYWALDNAFYNENNSKLNNNLLIELDSKVRDILSQNKTLESKLA